MYRFALPILPLIASACSPLRTFDALVPKDRGAALVARDRVFTEGPRGRLDLYAPTVRPPRPLPVIVFFYGGSWNSGIKEGYGFVGRALAAQGFLVAVPDYRLVPEIRYPAFLEDGAAAVQWVRANARSFGGDPDRIVLAGHSAGAYNAAMLALDPRWLGPDRTAVRGMVGLAGPYSFLPLDTAVTRAAFAGVPDLPSTQPIRHAHGDDPPALLLAGAEDDLVDPRQGGNLAQALNDAGAEAEARVYPGIGHVGILTAIARPLRGKAPVLADLGAFAARVTAIPEVDRRPAAHR